MHTTLQLCATVLTLFVVSATAAPRSQGSPACLNEDGKPVDWYIAYKFPELQRQRSPYDSGYSYAYITSDAVESKREPPPNISSWLNRFVINGISHRHSDAARNDSSSKSSEIYWTVSPNLITNPHSLVMRTLNLVYSSNSSKLNAILYNDQPPNKDDSDDGKDSLSPNAYRAHAKGVLLIDDILGDSVWLPHSTPKFPPTTDKPLEFYSNSKVFGQTFMCISFQLRNYGKQIINHISNMSPLVYEYRVSDRLETLVPQIKDLKIGRTRRTSQQRNKNDNLAQSIKTRAGQELLIYSKSSNFDKDLYADWMDKELKTDLFVETWRNGKGTPLNSTCPQNNYKVNNVKELNINQGNVDLTWSYHLDHSKWAISETRESGIVCISDINRMHSQFRRGGGAACIRCPKCWSVFSKTISEIEPCPR